MEVPLREASDAVHALRLMGYGLKGQDYNNEGRAIADVAWIACQRLDTLGRRVARCLGDRGAPPPRGWRDTVYLSSLPDLIRRAA